MNIYVLTVQGYDCAYEDWRTRLVTDDIRKIREQLKSIKKSGIKIVPLKYGIVMNLSRVNTMNMTSQENNKMTADS